MAKKNGETALQNRAGGPPAKSAENKKRFGDVFDAGYLKRVLWGAAVFCVLVAVSCYLVYKLSAETGADIVTQSCEYGKTELSLQAKGYVFRDETVLYSTYGGAFRYYYAGGEKVAKGKTVAVAYEDPGCAAAVRELETVEKEISVLKASEVKTDAGVAAAKKIESGAFSSVGEYRRSVSSGDYQAALRSGEKLNISLNRLEALFAGSEGFDGRLAVLEKRKKELEGRLTGNAASVNAASAGYFYSFCDGGENIFTGASLVNLTPAGLLELAEKYAASDEKEQAGRYPVGKMAPSPEWHLAVFLPADTREEFNAGETRTVVFDDFGGKSSEMTVERAAVTDNGVLVVFRSSDLSGSVETARVQNVSIRTGEISGLRVPADALRYLEGRTGVYVMYGNRVLFRVADITGRYGGWVYVSDDSKAVYETQTVTKNGETTEKQVLKYGPLRRYDEIIVSGRGLYHGMVVE